MDSVLAPAAVPTLDEVAADPERVGTLPPNVLQALLCRCLTVQTALLSGLLTASAERKDHPLEEPDSLVDVTAAAERLSVSRDWLYRHAKKLPYTARRGRQLRFSTRGISQEIRRRLSR